MLLTLKWYWVKKKYKNHTICYFEKKKIIYLICYNDYKYFLPFEEIVLCGGSAIAEKEKKFES